MSQTAPSYAFVIDIKFFQIIMEFVHLYYA